MDYILYGLGYGSTLMVLGCLFRYLGPALRYRERDDDVVDPFVDADDYEEARWKWRLFATGAGNVIALAGTFLLLVSVILMITNPGNELGQWIALAVSVLMVFSIAVWAWMFFRKWGAITPPPLEVEPAVEYAEIPRRAVAMSRPALAASDDNSDEDEDFVSEDVDETDDYDGENVDAEDAAGGDTDDSNDDPAEETVAEEVVATEVIAASVPADSDGEEEGLTPEPDPDSDAGHEASTPRTHHHPKRGNRQP